MLRKAYKIFGRSPVGTSISVLIKGKEKVFYKKKGITSRNFGEREIRPFYWRD